MLKITLLRERQGTRVALAGRLVGPWDEELLRCWIEAEADCRDRGRVDLRETTHVDAAGKALLSELFHHGVSFEVKGCLMRAIVESLAAEPGQSSHGWPGPQPAGKDRGS